MFWGSERTCTMWTATPAETRQVRTSLETASGPSSVRGRSRLLLVTDAPDEPNRGGRDSAVSCYDPAPFH